MTFLKEAYPLLNNYRHFCSKGTVEVLRSSFLFGEGAARTRGVCGWPFNFDVNTHQTYPSNQLTNTFNQID